MSPTVRAFKQDCICKAPVLSLQERQLGQSGLFLEEVQDPKGTEFLPGEEGWEGRGLGDLESRGAGKAQPFSLSGLSNLFLPSLLLCPSPAFTHLPDLLKLLSLILT